LAIADGMTADTAMKASNAAAHVFEFMVILAGLVV
jgi:hypothetical protein